MTGLPRFLLLLAWAGPVAASEGSEGAILPLQVWHVIPFVGLLLCIAILPMLLRHWWESNAHKLWVALGWAVPVAGWFIYQSASGHAGAGHAMVHAIEEYASFIILLGSLFVISGGVFLTGDLRATPWVNTAFLATGAIVANLFGTTGASMLLIRPLLRTNRQRRFVLHIPLFFIFLVSNVGGLLTPIGDPPLFLGYLRGVSFFWTMQHLWKIWLLPVGILLAVFFALDTWSFRKESKADRVLDMISVEPIRIQGGINLLLLVGVIASVILLSPGEGTHDLRNYHAREIVMVALALLSVFGTSADVRRRNAFTWGPIVEVAVLFVGIFITMVPATLLLQSRGASLGIHEPWQFFWASGALSSFLDNAPTYVTFASLACGIVPSCPSPEQLGSLMTGDGLRLLMAVSAGSVFMGANSYIGNGPNFMVRAIAEECGYKMPSFFGYMGYAALFLLPLFVLVTLVFFL